MSWISSAVDAIMARRRQDMQWQFMLAFLQQPTLDEESARAKAQLATTIASDLLGIEGFDITLSEEDDEEHFTNEGLLNQAGVFPVRIVDAGT